MSYTFYGFMVINALIDNTINTVSPLGELSPKARSFSKEVAIYHDDDYDDVRLFGFYSKENNTATPLTKELAKQVLALGDWLAKESGLRHIDADRSAFLQKLNAEYNTRISVKQVGKMVTNGTEWLPEYITFTLLSDRRQNTYKIWFADNAFKNQYDKYEIVVVPPIVNIDDFHKDRESVTNAINRHNLMDLHTRVNIASDGKPYTYVVTYEYSWVNPRDPADKIMTDWTAIIYGEAGQNADIIREVFANYVLANSDFRQPVWERIIPDLFIPTEMYLCPFWTKYATENLQLRGGIYSPTIPYRDIIPFALKTMYNYTEAHLKENAAVFGSIYKSIAFVACGNEKNRLTPNRFELAWPDYCNIYTTSRDFNRISPETQTFILFMNELLLEAETMTPDSDVPIGMSRVLRGDLYYITKQHNGCTYLVPLRYNFLNEITNNQSSAIRLPTLQNQGSQTSDVSGRVSDVVDMTPTITGLAPGDTTRGRTIGELNPVIDVGTVVTPLNSGSTPAASQPNV